MMRSGIVGHRLNTIGIYPEKIILIKLHKPSVLAALILLSIATFAGSGGSCDIQIRVHNLPNSKMILAYYYGDRQYVKDTFLLDSQGICRIREDSRPAYI